MFYRQIKRAGGLPFEISNARTVQELEEDMYRLKECRAGHYIEHDKVDAWLRTIGTDNELPCPSK